MHEERTPSDAVLIRWDAGWMAPIIDATCPSCGFRRHRSASSWAVNDGWLRARFGCRSVSNFSDGECYRVWDEWLQVA